MSSSRFTILLAGYFLAHISSVFASTLTLKEVLNSSIKDFPGLNAQRASLQSIEGKAFSNVGIFDPELKAQYEDKDGFYNRQFQSLSIEQNTPLWGLKLLGGFRRSQGLLPIYEFGQETLNQGEWMGGIQVPILQGGWIDEKRSKLYASEKEADSASFRLKNSELDTLRVSAHLYWDWVHAGFRYTIQKSLLELARDRDRQLRLRVQHGDLPAIELDENQRAILQRETLLLAAERALQKAALDLSLVYRQNDGTPQLPASNLIPKSIVLPETLAFDDELKNPDQKLDSVKNHPQFISLQYQEQKNRIELDWAKQQHLPKLDFKLIATQDRGAGSSSLRQREYSLGLFFEMPLLFREGRGRIQSARANLDKTQNEQQLIQDQIQIRIQDTSQNFENTLKQIQLIHDEVLVAQKVERAERLRFEKGDSSLLMVNLREQMTADAQIREVQTQTQLWKAWIDYKIARGERFWESL